MFLVKEYILFPCQVNVGFVGLHDSHGRVSVQYPNVKLLRNYPFKFSGPNQSGLPESPSSLTFDQVASSTEQG